MSSVVIYENTSVTINDGTSVLDALEDAQFTIPYSCRVGVCHSCVMQAEGDIPPSAQQGLSTSQIAQNYFLACCCYPTADLTVRLKGAAELSKGKVVAKKKLNRSVLALFIQVDFSWLPGQYLTLWKDDVNGRPYSIASRYDEDQLIELHIKRHDQGCVSRWLHDDLAVDDLITLSEPLGDCFYNDDHQDKPVLMACTGTGLAPLYGILQEALAQQHHAPITLYVASGEPSGLYYTDELNALAKKYHNIRVITIVKRNAQEGMLQQDVIDTVKHNHPDLKGHKVFLCGAPDVVKKIQRNCFFAGASISDILVDAFEVNTPKKL